MNWAHEVIDPRERVGVKSDPDDCPEAHTHPGGLRGCFDEPSLR